MTPIRIQVSLESLQVGAKFGGRLIPQVRIFLQRLAEDVFDSQGHSRIQARRRSSLRMQDSVKYQCNG
jgi:hypothetical protein